ncbi:MAG: trigger factor, partial [Mogibacterium sp.]|nr:trigger factor [Mogibacterium sp.]
LNDYKGIAAEKPDTAVTEQDLEDEIARMADRVSRLVEVTDRPAASGDTAVINYEGFVGDVAFEGGKGENHELVLGSGQFIPGFEDQVIGHNVGESFDVNVKFPDEYHADALAGKDATFKCSLEGLKVKELPEIDDEFAKDVSSFDTLAALKEDLMKKLQDQKAAYAEQKLEESLLNSLADLVVAEIPQCMIDRKAEEMINDFAGRLSAQGLPLDKYLEYAGMDMEAMRKSMLPQAEHQVKVNLGLEKVAELEAIEVSEEDIADSYAKIAESYGIDADKVKAVIPAEDIIADLKNSKAVDLIKSQAKITTSKAAEDK